MYVCGFQGRFYQHNFVFFVLVVIWSLCLNYSWQVVADFEEQWVTSTLQGWETEGQENGHVPAQHSELDLDYYSTVEELMEVGSERLKEVRLPNLQLIISLFVGMTFVAHSLFFILVTRSCQWWSLIKGQGHICQLPHIFNFYITATSFFLQQLQLVSHSTQYQKRVVSDKINLASKPQQQVFLKHFRTVAFRLHLPNCSTKQGLSRVMVLLP